MANSIQFRRDNALVWYTTNPILGEGEIGVEKDSSPSKWKFGDGVTAWNSLPYFAGTGFYSGSGAPSNSSYTEGDHYFDTTGYNIYKKASGVWNIIDNLKGATGVSGIGDLEYGIPDCTLNGMGITQSTGLNVNVAAGKVVKGETLYNYNTSNSLTLTPRMASLIYANNSDLTIGKIEAALPAVDSNTVARWIIDGSATIANSAVGVNGNTIAVANNLTKGGTVTQVDGWLGYGGQGDGSTGYYTSANYTGIPIGATEREIVILYKCNSVSTSEVLFCYGATTTFEIVVYSGNLSVNVNVVTINTTFNFEIGKTYLLNWLVDGVYHYLYVNGVKIFSEARALNTTATTSNILRRENGGYPSASVIYYVEIRNKMRTPQAIAQMSNALLLPLAYDKINAVYPTIATSDLALAYHEYKFDELTGTTVADSSGLLNGTATGTTIVDSQIGLGKARKFSATTDLIACGAVALPTAFTMIFVGNIASYALVKTLFSNRNAACTSGNLVFINTTGTVYFNTAATSYNLSTALITTGKSTFITIVFNGTTASLYQDSEYLTNTATITSPSNTSNPLYLGYDLNTTANTFSGTMEYMNIIPRALSQVEVAGYYNALMGSYRADVRNLLPANTNSLGFVRTSSTLPIEIANDYKYGVRKEFNISNRRKFIVWRYMAASSTYNFVNPFGTENVIVKEIWYKKNITDSTHTRIDGIYTTMYYGVYVKGATVNNIQLYTGTYLVAGASNYTGADQSSGYVGFWIEAQDL